MEVGEFSSQFRRVTLLPAEMLARKVIHPRGKIILDNSNPGR